jgi:hypothetical protein
MFQLNIPATRLMMSLDLRHKSRSHRTDTMVPVVIVGF